MDAFTNGFGMMYLGGTHHQMPVRPLKATLCSSMKVFNMTWMTTETNPNKPTMLVNPYSGMNLVKHSGFSCFLVQRQNLTCVGGLFILGFMIRLRMFFGFLFLCCSCFTAFLLFCFFAFPVSLLFCFSCFSAFLLFCFSAF